MSNGRIKYTKEFLAPFVEKSSSYRDLLINLGLKPDAGGNHQNLKRLVALLGLDTSHFTGQGWSAGKTQTTDKRIAVRYTDEELFTYPSPMQGSIASTLKPRLIQLGVPYQCNCCGLKDSWQGKPITIELHHRNGNRLDNRVENLEFLCPNCHSQTNTYRGRNIPREKNQKVRKPRYVPPSNQKPLPIAKEQFQLLVKLYTLSDLTCIFNTSHVTLGKWARKHGIELPSHSYWRKKGAKDNYGITIVNTAKKMHDEGLLLKDVVQFILDSQMGKKHNRRKVERPSKEELQRLLWEFPTVKLAEKYGISDKAIEKWAKAYGLTKPPRGYWARKYSGQI